MAQNSAIPDINRRGHTYTPGFSCKCAELWSAKSSQSTTADYVLLLEHIASKSCSLPHLGHMSEENKVLQYSEDDNSPRTDSDGREVSTRTYHTVQFLSTVISSLIPTYTDIKAVFRMLDRDLKQSRWASTSYLDHAHETPHTKIPMCIGFKDAQDLLSIYSVVHIPKNFKYFAISIVLSLPAESRPRHVSTSEQSFRRPDPPRYK